MADDLLRFMEPDGSGSNGAEAFSGLSDAEIARLLRPSAPLPAAKTYKSLRGFFAQKTAVPLPNPWERSPFQQLPWGGGSAGVSPPPVAIPEPRGYGPGSADGGGGGGYGPGYGGGGGGPGYDAGAGVLRGGPGIPDVTYGLPGGGYSGKADPHVIPIPDGFGYGGGGGGYVDPYAGGGPNTSPFDGPGGDWGPLVPFDAPNTDPYSDPYANGGADKGIYTPPDYYGEKNIVPDSGQNYDPYAYGGAGKSPNDLSYDPMANDPMANGGESGNGWGSFGSPGDTSAPNDSFNGGNSDGSFQPFTTPSYGETIPISSGGGDDSNAGSSGGSDGNAAPNVDSGSSGGLAGDSGMAYAAGGGSAGGSGDAGSAYQSSGGGSNAPMAAGPGGGYQPSPNNPRGGGGAGVPDTGAGPVQRGVQPSQEWLAGLVPRILAAILGLLIILVALNAMLRRSRNG